MVVGASGGIRLVVARSVGGASGTHLALGRDGVVNVAISERTQRERNKQLNQQLNGKECHLGLLCEAVHVFFT